MLASRRPGIRKRRISGAVAFLKASFTQANGNIAGTALDVGGVNWSAAVAGGVSNVVSSNQLVGPGNTNLCGNVAASSRTDGTVQITLVSLGGDGNRIRLKARSDGGGASGRFNGYAFLFNTNVAGTGHSLQTWSAGAGGTVASGTTFTLAAGDILKGKLVGTTLTMSVLRGATETVLYTATDATFTTGTYWGVELENGSLNAPPTLDDWQVA